MNEQQRNGVAVSLGGVLPGWQAGDAAGIRYHYVDGPGHWWVNTMEEPSDDELELLQLGEMQWELATWPGLTVLYLHIANLGWSEALIQVRRAPALAQGIAKGDALKDPERIDGTGAWICEPFTLLVVDAATGVVRAMRWVVLAHDFMFRLNESLRHQVHGPVSSDEDVATVIASLRAQSVEHGALAAREKRLANQSGR